MKRYSSAEVLESLEKDYAKVVQLVDNFGWIPKDDQEIGKFLANIQAWKTFFAGYHDVAGELKNQGFPRVAERLSEIQSDLDQLIQRWQLEVSGVKEVSSWWAETHRTGSQRTGTNTTRDISNGDDEARRKRLEEHFKHMEETRRRLFHSGSTPINTGFPVTPTTPAVPVTPTVQWTPLPDPPYVPRASNSRHSAYCKVWECGKQCVQPAGHGGPCRCENNHSDYW